MNFSKYKQVLSQISAQITPNENPFESNLIFTPDFIFAASFKPTSSGYVLFRINIEDEDIDMYEREFGITSINKCIAIPVIFKDIIKSESSLDISLNKSRDNAIICSGRSKSTIPIIDLADKSLPDYLMEEFWPAKYKRFPTLDFQNLLSSIKTKEFIQDGPMILSRYLFIDSFVYTMENTRCMEIAHDDLPNKNFAIPTKTLPVFKAFTPDRYSFVDNFVFFTMKGDVVEFGMPYKDPVLEHFSPEQYFDFEISDCDIQIKGGFKDDLIKALEHNKVFARSISDPSRFSVEIIVEPKKILVKSENEKGSTVSEIFVKTTVEESFKFMVNPEDLLAAIKETDSMGIRFETDKTRPYIMVENKEVEMKQIVFISA